MSTELQQSFYAGMLKRAHQLGITRDVFEKIAAGPAPGLTSGFKPADNGQVTHGTSMPITPTKPATIDPTSEGPASFTAPGTGDRTVATGLGNLWNKAQEKVVAPGINLLKAHLAGDRYPTVADIRNGGKPSPAPAVKQPVAPVQQAPEPSLASTQSGGGWFAKQPGYQMAQAGIVPPATGNIANGINP